MLFVGGWVLLFFLNGFYHVMVFLLVRTEHFVTAACGKYQAPHGYKHQEAVEAFSQCPCLSLSVAVVSS